MIMHVNKNSNDGDQVQQVEISRICTMPQDRTTFAPNQLRDLADNLAASGQAQPVLLRPHPDLTLRAEGYLLVVFGERRLRAAQMLGWSHIKATIEGMDDRTAARRQWSENQGRVNLNPVEQAHAIERRIKAEGWATDAEAARELGMPESTLRDRLKLLRLIPDVLELIALDIVPQTYGLAMADLYPAFQQVALRYLRDMKRLHPATFRQFCQKLLERQCQGDLWEGFMQPEDPVPPEIEVLASLDGMGEEKARPYPEHPCLPPVPTARTAAAMLELYIANLFASPNPVCHDAAHVVGHVYNALLAANRIKR